MVASILFLILFLIVISGILFFVFSLLLPSLKSQGFDVEEPLFSKEETEFLTVSPKFNHIDTGKKAIVTSPNARDNNVFTYDNRLDCSLFASIYETDFDADNGCIGFGSCQKVCTTEAIKIHNHTAVIYPSCNGCGLCVDYCPKNFIKLVPVDTKEYADYVKDNSLKVQSGSQKGLQFWQKCYNILNRK